MREESHLDDMRAAIRGDFERLAERRGHQELMREEEPRSEAEASREEGPRPEEQRDRLALVPSPTEDAAEADTRPADPAPPEHKRAWLERLRGR